MNRNKEGSEQNLAGRVAVITGAASGIGLGLALRAAQAGMKIALADIEAPALEKAVALVKAHGVAAIGVKTDVSSMASVQELARRVEAELGAPWLVINNAGVAKPGLTWKLSEADWKWVFDVNLNGVLHGILTFVPGLVERDSGYVVNVASAAGLLGIPGGAPYVASKHAIVGMSESLYRELRATKSAVEVSVVCPALVNTNIAHSERNRPGQNVAPQPMEGLPPIPADVPLNVLQPEDIAEHVFAGIANRRFWILPHAEQLRPTVLSRASQMIEGINPDQSSMDRVSILLHSMATGVNFLD